MHVQSVLACARLGACARARVEFLGRVTGDPKNLIPVNDMGLYDERLNEAHSRRVADRRGLRSRPFAEVVAARRSRPVPTNPYVRIDPNGLRVKRTATSDRVEKKEDTAMKRRPKKAHRTAKRSASSATKPAFGSPAWRAMYPSKGRRRKVRASTVKSTVKAAPATVVKARRRRKVRSTVKSTVKAATVVQSRHKPRRRVRSTVKAAPIVQARRKPRRRVHSTVKAAPIVQARRKPRRRVRSTVKAAPVVRARKKSRRHYKARSTVKSTVQAFHGNRKAHSRAAKKGWRKRKAAKRHTTRETSIVQTRRRPSRRRTREFTYAKASHHRKPRRRNKHKARESVVKQTVRSSRRRHYARSSMTNSLKAKGKMLGKLAAFTGAAASSFLIVDWFDRLLATVEPGKQSKDKFTSDGTGMLGNALNVASSPHLYRILNVVGSTLVPAVASVYVKNGYLRASLEGAAVGAGVKAISLFVTNVLVPMLAPKDDAKLNSSHIARLYPAEVAAHLNMKAAKKDPSALDATTTPGALSGPDVGPFAVGGSSPYPSAAQALRREAGMSGPEEYPSAIEALQAGVDGPGGYRPAPPTGRRFENNAVNQWRGAHPMYRPGGYNASQQWSQRWGNNYQPQYGIPAAPTPGGPSHHHHHCMLRAKTHFPSYSDAQLHQWCNAHPHHTHPYLYESPQVTTGTVGAPQDLSNTGLSPQEMANAVSPPPPSAGPTPAPQLSVPSAPTPDPVGPPTYQPGPGSGPGPGPTPINSECGCVGEDNKFLGFIGDAQEDTLYNSK